VIATPVSTPYSDAYSKRRTRRPSYPSSNVDNKGEIANEVGEEETIDEVDEFLSKRNAIVKTFIQGIRGLCAEQGRDFRTAINEITIDLPPIAMRTRTYKPNA